MKPVLLSILFLMQIVFYGYGQGVEERHRMTEQNHQTARALIARGQFKAAIDLLEDESSIDYPSALILNDLGVAYVGTGDFTAAVLAFRAATKADPGMIQARKNLVRGLASDKRYREATKELRKLIETEGETPESLNDLSVIQHQWGKSKDAIKIALTALRLAPSDPLILYNLGVFHLESGKALISVKYLRQALDTKHDYPAARYALALAYFSLDDRGAMLREYSFLKLESSDLAEQLFKLIFTGKVIDVGKRK